MQTMTLWVVASFSTAISFSASMSRPSSRAAADPSSSSRALNSGSVQARATTFAPPAGERASMRAMAAAISSGVVTPFSTSSSRTAISSACASVSGAS